MMVHVLRTALGVGCLVILALLVSLLEWLTYGFPAAEKMVVVTVGVLSCLFLFGVMAYIIGYMFL